MEQKMIRVPFSVELAKAITNGEKEGRIVTREGKSARIICWDLKSEDGYKIAALVPIRNNEEFYSYTQDGVELRHGGFQKDDLMLEVPEYTTYKKGDVLFIKDNAIAILKDGYHKDENNEPCCRAFVVQEKEKTCNIQNVYFDEDARLASEIEKQKVINLLLGWEDSLIRNSLKMLGIKEEIPKYELKPFDRVLIRYGEGDKWTASIFSHKEEGDYPLHCCINGRYEQCIPYNEETAHLLGTTDNP